MAVLGTIVKALVRAMFNARHELALCRTIGSELVGDKPFRGRAVFFQKLDQQPLCCSFIMSALQDFIEHDPILIDRAPQPETVFPDLHPHFIEMPNITRTGLTSAQTTGNRGAKLCYPSAQRFVGNVDATLQQHLLDLAKAEVDVTTCKHKLLDLQTSV